MSALKVGGVGRRLEDGKRRACDVAYRGMHEERDAVLGKQRQHATCAMGWLGICQWVVILRVWSSEQLVGATTNETIQEFVLCRGAPPPEARVPCAS